MGRQAEQAPTLDDENYTPSGRTALHDALDVAITETAQYIDPMGAASQPGTVLVVVLTDGKENASETPQQRVRDLVESRRDEHGWEFLFIGANQDAALAASRMGMDRKHALNMAHSGEGARHAYESTSRAVSQARQEGSTRGYDESDHRKQDES